MPREHQHDPQQYYRLAHGLVILYEDRDLLAVDKPAGLLSIAAGTEREKTAYWILSEYLRKKGEKRRAAVVHRLDRDTSGVMIFAKSGKVKEALMDNWDNAVTGRRYIALAEGEITGTEGVIDKNLGEDRGGNMIVVQEGGQRAVTRWRVIKAGKNFSLVALELETGRRNQIRAHLSWFGHPVSGDRKYHAKTDPFKRLCLHAERIVFAHPHDGRSMEFEVKAPEGWQTKCGRGK
jgi:23S rRNA pseudouridine1911/1915/1917 synthase